MSRDGSTAPRRRVTIVGGGFGGIAAAKTLRRADVDVTIVDRMNHHLFQPLLYQAATGALLCGQCAGRPRDAQASVHLPRATAYPRQADATVLMDEARIWSRSGRWSCSWGLVRSEDAR
jgi:NADH dehydrogenase